MYVTAGICDTRSLRVKKTALKHTVEGYRVGTITSLHACIPYIW